MDKAISNLDPDTKISYHILRYASVPKCTKMHVLGWFSVSKNISKCISSYPNPFLDAPDPYTPGGILGYD